MSHTRHVPSTSVERVPGGDVIERHRHRGHQLIYVSAGVLVVRTADGSWVAASDRAIWIPSRTWHEHRAYGASTIHTVGFADDPPALDADRPAIVAVDALLRELLLVVGDPQLGRAEVTRLRAVLRDRLRRTAQDAVSLPAARDPRLGRACEIALEALSTPLPLAVLASRAGTTERTLSRLFRGELGMSYPRWRSHARALRAMVLLAEGRTVTETAHACGWSTTSAFIDSFRRAHGQTPGAYRDLGTATPGLGGRRRLANGSRAGGQTGEARGGAALAPASR